MMRKLLVSSALALSLCLAPMAVAQGRDSVRNAQQALKAKGFDPGPIDGVMGPKTHAAIRSYQEKNNLSADGRLGAQTLGSLGVENAAPGTKMKMAGTNVKESYSSGGKQIGEGSKALGSDVKHGEVVDGAKAFGKGVGHGAAKMGVGTGHAAKNAATAVKDKAVDAKDKVTGK
jgi:peptidoglycan hydrolase-like protein with peptidoglycan-binding domain